MISVNIILCDYFKMWRMRFQDFMAGIAKIVFYSIFDNPGCQQLPP